MSGMRFVLAPLPSSPEVVIHLTRRSRLALLTQVGDDLLHRVQGAGPNLDLFRRADFEELFAVDSSDEVVFEIQHAVNSQYMWNQVIGE